MKYKNESGDSYEIEPNIYDIEEIYPNCTVQVLRNSVTGEISVGWWPNTDEEEYDDEI